MEVIVHRGPPASRAAAGPPRSDARWIAPGALPSRGFPLVLALCLLPAVAAAELTSPPGELAAQLDAVVARAYPAGQPGAAVLIVKDGRPLLRKAYGLANVELRVPNRPEQVFRIGSVTKQFTAAAILLLAERGKLALNDEIPKHLPGYPARGPKITIEHLLTHTSGIPNYTSLPEFRGKARFDLTHDEMLALWKDKPLDFPPGSKWQYSNSGYYLLGLIIEKVSGMTYAEFLDQNIFRPLGLSHTRYDKPEDIIPDRAAGYEDVENKLTNAAYLSMALPFAAGALVSTVDDLARWSAALFDGKLISRASLQRMTTPYKLPSGETTGYGYGLGISAHAGHRVVSHAGGINGFQSALLVLPEEHIVAVVLSNRAGGQATLADLLKRLAGLASGRQ